MTMTKGSLCTGTGALDAALPGDLVWLAETDDAATLLLKREHPEVTNLGDITRQSERFTHVDLLTSGDPCQSMSEAGRRGSALADQRFLWPWVMEAIRYARPTEIFLENVEGLTSATLIKGAPDWRGERGSVLKLRLDDLRRAGYAVRWMVLGACAVGAPHHRHRWFLRARHVGWNAPPAERVPATCGAPRGGQRALLPSPRGSDHARGSEPDRGARTGTGGTLLDTAARLHDGWGEFTPAIQLWGEIIGRPAPDPTVSGARPGGRPRLNPALSEWMMGYPEGYLTKDLDRKDALRCAGNGVVRQQAEAAWELLGSSLAAAPAGC